MLFVGIATSGSAARAAFPSWGPMLGLGSELEGIDLPVGSHSQSYRGVVERVRNDPTIRGVVITAHKRAMFAHARDMLDDLDPDVRTCGEISVIHRSGDRLIGSLIEPESCRVTLSMMLAGNHWQLTRDLLIFGAGGTATAIMLCLFRVSQQEWGPRRLTLYDVDPSRLNASEKLMVKLGAEVEFVTRLTEQSSVNPLSGIDPGALIVNATGLGKDRPGSPVALPADWPDRSVIWDLNYRGDRPFWRDALEQASGRHLMVHDGWSLFIRGWAESLGLLAHRPLTPEEISKMDEAAARVRIESVRGSA